MLNFIRGLEMDMRGKKEMDIASFLLFEMSKKVEEEKEITKTFSDTVVTLKLTPNKKLNAFLGVEKDVEIFFNSEKVFESKIRRSQEQFKYWEGYQFENKVNAFSMGDYPTSDIHVVDASEVEEKLEILLSLIENMTNLSIELPNNVEEISEINETNTMFKSVDGNYLYTYYDGEYKLIMRKHQFDESILLIKRGKPVFQISWLEHADMFCICNDYKHEQARHISKSVLDLLNGKLAFAL